MCIKKHRRRNHQQKYFWIWFICSLEIFFIISSVFSVIIIITTIHSSFKTPLYCIYNGITWSGCNKYNFCVSSLFLIFFHGCYFYLRSVFVFQNWYILASSVVRCRSRKFVFHPHICLFMFKHTQTHTKVITVTITIIIWFWQQRRNIMNKKKLKRKRNAKMIHFYFFRIFFMNVRTWITRRRFYVRCDVIHIWYDGYQGVYTFNEWKEEKEK